MIFLHPVALGNDLISSGSLEGMISYCACRLFVCYFATFHKLYFCDMFRPYKFIIRQILLRNSCTVSFSSKSNIYEKSDNVGHEQSTSTTRESLPSRMLWKLNRSIMYHRSSVHITGQMDVLHLLNRNVI
jgi:hypothetical protein